MTGEIPVVRPTPPDSAQWFDWRNPALWMFVALSLPGLWLLSGSVRLAFTAYPSAATAAAVLFTAYTVPFIVVLRRLDYLEREPPVLTAMAFGWGGVVASMAAVGGGQATQAMLAKLVSPTFAAEWGPAIGPPVIEEVLKALGVVLVVLLARAHVNSTVDGFVYGAFVGLGFQVVEDFVYAVGATAWSRGGDEVGPVISTFIVRGFLTGLWSHTVFTALAGGGIAYAVVNVGKPLARRLGVAAGAVAAAIAAHALWNSPLLRDGFGFGGIGIVGALFIKGVPVFLLVWFLFARAYNTEAAFYGAQLDRYVGTPLVHEDEQQALLSYSDREAARRQAQSLKGRRGMRAAQAVRRLQHLQTHLSVLSSRYPETPKWVLATVEDPPTRQWLHAEHNRLSGLAARRELPPAGRREMLHRVAVQRCVVDLLAQRSRLEHLGMPVAVGAKKQKRSPMAPWALTLAVLGVLVPGAGAFAMVAALMATRGHLPSDRLAVAAFAIGALNTTGWVLAFALLRLGAG